MDKVYQTLSRCRDNTYSQCQAKDGKIIIGRIKLPDSHFSDSWYVETKEARLHENDLLVVSPFDYWFRDNQDKLYDTILNMYMRKRRDGLLSLLDAIDTTDAMTIAYITGEYASAASILALNCDQCVAGNLAYRDWETDRKSTRLNSSHSAKSRMPSSA